MVPPLLKYGPLTILVFLTSVPCALLFAANLILGLFIPWRWFVFIEEGIWSLYQRSVLFAYEHCSGVMPIFYGDAEECFSKKETVLCVVNHQTSADWIVAEMLAVRQGSLGNMRFIIKEGIKWVPLYGWYFPVHGCIYVGRSGTFRQDTTENGLKYLVEHIKNFWLVIFPEAVRYTPNRTALLAKCQKHSIDHGLPPLKHLLSPRSKGFNLTLSTLRHRLDAIYDVTLLYTPTVNEEGHRVAAPDMYDYVGGPSGRELHVHMKRIPMEEVPEAPEEVERWLHMRFVEKDKMLNACFNEPHTIFPDCKRSSLGALPLKATLPATAALTAGVIAIAVFSYLTQICIATIVVSTLGGFVYLLLQEVGWA